MHKKIRPESTVRRAAAELRSMVLSKSDGEFVGSEAELMSALRISRPTFRQAAKLVEQEQLVRIKRGIGGGFFAQRPTPSGVAHVAAVYLRSREATVEDAVRSARPIFAEIARIAAKRANPDTYSRFAAFVAEDRNFQGDFRAFLRTEVQFLSIFASAADNPVLELYANVLVDFASTFVGTSVMARDAERVIIYRSLRLNVIQAILSGDEEVAYLHSLRRSDAILSWMDADQVLKKAGTGSRGRRAPLNLIGTAN